jgi:hypothetical protein
LLLNNVLTILMVSLLWLSQPATGATDPVAKPEPGTTPPAPTGSDLVYGLDYQAKFLPENGIVEMTLTVNQSRHLLRRVRFKFDPARYSDFSGDGEILVDGNEVSWRPPVHGGVLTYSMVLNHRRKSGGFDSLMEGDWAIFRGDDLLPTARITARKGSSSRARLQLSGPENWSFISAYPDDKQDPGWSVVNWPDRKFDRPVGWMAAGWLGVRRGTIAGVKVAVAGPIKQGVRHMDILAFLRWNLPVLVEIFPGFPKRLLVVSAGDPMWRGGLSGPRSLYLHADRPLISSNGTSTLLHELVHVAQGYRAAKNEDWIVEAIAEYYTLEIMQRSGTLSNSHTEQGFEKLEQWAGQVDSLEAKSSAGPRTAKGVTVMRDLDTELRLRTKDKRSLDDVARQLARDGQPVSIVRLREVSAELAGAPLDAISPEKIQAD